MPYFILGMEEQRKIKLSTQVRSQRPRKLQTQKLEYCDHRPPVLCSDLVEEKSITMAGTLDELRSMVNCGWGEKLCGPLHQRVHFEK